MTAEVIGWRDEHLLEHRRRLRNGCLVSVAVHGLLAATLIVSPPRSAPLMPEVIAIDLLAALPAARVVNSRPAPKPPVAPEPAPVPPAPKAPVAPAPPPEVVAPPPPVVRAPVQVLPEETPGRLRKALPEPQRVVPLEPKPEPRRQRRQRAKAFSYEDAMAALDDELGLDESAALLQPPPGPTVEPDESSSRARAVVSSEMLEWTEATTRRLQSKWVTPTSFRGRGLATSLELELSASGQVLGTPRVLRSSGDPYFDENAVRAVLMVDLPAPPRAGVTVFVFRSEVD